jgi:hypothetical protein
MKFKESKFVLRVDPKGIHLIEGKLPNRHQQLWNGELTTGTKCQAAFDEHVGITFYHECWN